MACVAIFLCLSGVVGVVVLLCQRGVAFVAGHFICVSNVAFVTWICASMNLCDENSICMELPVGHEILV